MQYEMRIYDPSARGQTKYANAKEIIAYNEDISLHNTKRKFTIPLLGKRIQHPKTPEFAAYDVDLWHGNVEAPITNPVVFRKASLESHEFLGRTSSLDGGNTQDSLAVSVPLNRMHCDEEMGGRELRPGLAQDRWPGYRYQAF
ncbi:hypothetical protein EDD15DRAFT_2192466 [Pisolithus albus]|nr:hypothetical protein EDD15DRAFT_2192466 [Pisolithus albus]